MVVDCEITGIICTTLNVFHLCLGVHYKFLIKTTNLICRNCTVVGESAK